MQCCRSGQAARCTHDTNLASDQMQCARQRRSRPVIHVARARSRQSALHSHVHVHHICKHLHVNFFSLCDRHEARHCLPFGCLGLLSFSLLLLIFQLDCQSTLCPLVAIEFSLGVDEAISLLDVGEAIFLLDVDVLSGWRLVTKAMGGWRLESKVMSRWTLKYCAGADDTAMKICVQQQ